MYLVHIHLRPSSSDDLLPDDVAAVMADSAMELSGLEHVIVHSMNHSAPVIGVYIRSATLEEAEALAEDIWWRSCGTCRSLRRWTLVRAEVPLLPSEEQRKEDPTAD